MRLQNGNGNLKAKMMDLGNTSLKTREYQAQNTTDLRIIPVLTVQLRIIPVPTQDNTRLKNITS